MYLNVNNLFWNVYIELKENQSNIVTRDILIKQYIKQRLS